MRFLKYGGITGKEIMFEKIYLGVMIVVAVAATILSWYLEQDGLEKRDASDSGNKESKVEGAIEN